MHTSIFAILSIAAGCAPKGMEQGLAFYADQYQVRDAAARRVQGYGCLRFNELILSDLDDAIAAGSAHPEEMRRLGLQAIRAAASLAREAGIGEIDRLPEPGRRALAEVASAPQATVRNAFERKVTEDADRLVDELQSMEATALRARLRHIRGCVEPLPDEKGRAGRQMLLAWAALPAWAGVNNIENEMEQRKKDEFKPFEQSIAFVPKADDAGSLVARYAPTIVLETPPERSYPADYDRFGEVYLTGDPARIEVHVNTSRPTAYGYSSQAKINGKRYPQLVYVWWFPERPSMTHDDPAAGRIDGDTLRITLDAQNRPAIFEVVQGCGCGHLVYVADFVEEMARREFGQPSEGKDLAVERDVADRRDLIVSGTVAVPPTGCRPVVYVEAGYHAVAGLRCEDAAAHHASETEQTYAIDDYDHLDHLTLGSGFGSMFGPDGLVHNAGRKEGYLLAPTGMLSAGQPRKRGTQRIRWDEYSFEDPRLLEKALRLPSNF